METFALRSHQIITRLLREHRPHWAQSQETVFFGSLVDFTSPSQPCIMRLSCDKALPSQITFRDRWLIENECLTHCYPLFLLVFSLFF